MYEKSKKILVIDDDQAVRESLAFFLEDQGYFVIQADNGRTGIDRFRNESADLVMVDLRMPEVDGLEVLSTLSSENADTPLIVVSGTGIIQDAIEALRHGAWEYLLKPIQDYSLLTHAIESTLEKAELIKENRRYQDYLEKMVEVRTSELKNANADLFRINTRMKEIAEITKTLSLCTGMEYFGSLFLQEFGQHMFAEGGSFFKAEKEGLRLVKALDPGHAPDFIPFPLMEGSLLKAAVDSGQPILASDIEKIVITPSGWKGYSGNSAMIFPLISRNSQLNGVLTLHSRSRGSFSNQDLEIGKILAAYGSEALTSVLATEEIKDREEQYRAILNTATDAIVTIDETSRIYIWNKSAEAMFGYKKNEVSGTEIHELLVPEEFREQANRGFRQFLQTGKGIVLGNIFEMTGMKKNGDEIPIELSVSNFTAKGKTHATAIIRDITRRRLAENRIMQALKEKNALLQEVNHRVKNNLNVIISLLNLKADSIESEKSAIEAFEESRNLVYSMAMVHEELYQSNDLSEINMKDFIAKLAVKLIEIYNPFVNIKHRLYVDDIKIDVNRAVPCGLILTEIITNSLKHAYKKSVSDGLLEISFAKTEEASFRITVRDNGSGIPDKVDLEHPETTGLQLINVLTNQIDGKISIISGKGTEFVVEFPETAPENGTADIS